MSNEQQVAAKGWKTYTAAAIMVLFAIGGVVLNFVAPESDYAMSIEVAGLLAAKGLAVLGIGHKLQKLIEVLKK